MCTLKFKIGACAWSTMRWLIPHSYKKNLKALYVIHPTKFVKFCLKMLQPFIR